MHIEDAMVMYGIYNAETLEKLIKTVCGLHMTKPMQEQLFAGELTAAHSWYIHSHSTEATEQYAINSILHLRMIKDKIYTIVQRIQNTAAQI